MKKIRVTSILSSLLIAAFAMSSCSGPQAVEGSSEASQDDTSSSSASAESETSGTAITDEPVTLTYYVDALGNCVIQSFNDNVAYQEVEKRLNINLEFQHAAQGQMAEQLGVMIASRDLPDIVDGFFYSNGPDAAVEDGIIYELNDLVVDNAPDFLALLESDPEIMRQTITDSGMIYCFPCLQPKEEPAWRGVSIRLDILNELGLEKPATLGELEEACIAMKDYGVTYPISISIKNNTTYSGDSLFVSAFGIGANWYLDLNTREVKYGPMQDEYLEFLTLMNKWYEEGIMDPEYNTRTGDDRNTLIANGDIAVFEMGYGPTSNCQMNGEAQNPDFLLEPLSPLPLNEGETVQARNMNPINKGNETVITTNCQNPEVAARFLNYGYTEEGTMLYNYGVEGVSYTMVDGEPQWTELITNGEEGAWVNIRDKYKKHTGPYLRDWAAFPGTEQDYYNMEVWNTAGTDLMMPTKLTLTSDETERFSNLMADINTFLDESLTGFINGSKPLSEFDAFREQLTSMGIEEAQQIRRDAYERYQSRELTQ